MGMNYISIFINFMGVHKNTFVDDDHPHYTNYSDDYGFCNDTIFPNHFHECQKYINPGYLQ